MAKKEVYIDEANKVIFTNLNGYLEQIKKSVKEQDKGREYYIQREINISKIKIEEKLLTKSNIYRLRVYYNNTMWTFYLENYEQVKEKIEEILKNGLYLFDDEKAYRFDKFIVDLIRVRIWTKK